MKNWVVITNYSLLRRSVQKPLSGDLFLSYIYYCIYISLQTTQNIDILLIYLSLDSWIMADENLFMTLDIAINFDSKTHVFRLQQRKWYTDSLFRCTHFGVQKMGDRYMALIWFVNFSFNSPNKHKMSPLNAFIQASGQTLLMNSNVTALNHNLKCSPLHFSVLINNINS